MCDTVLIVLLAVVHPMLIVESLGSSLITFLTLKHDTGHPGSKVSRASRLLYSTELIQMSSRSTTAGSVISRFVPEDRMARRRMREKIA